MSIGASEPTEKGCLFSWGGTDPTCCESYGVVECGKNYFFWDDYEFSVNGGSTPGTTNYKFNKYCPSGKASNYYASGFSGDSLTQLLPVDDAATVNWGENWTLPTKEQFEELIANTTLSYTSIDNANIYTFTSSNGNSITFASSGSSWGPSISSDSSCGGATYPGYAYVWSKDLKVDTPYTAYALQISNSSSQVINTTKAVGIPIRPVVKVQNQQR